MQSVRSGTGEWVYVIGSPEAGLVKIGASKNPGQRLVALQGAARRRKQGNTIMPRSIFPEQLMVLYQQPGGQPIEKQLHWFFASSWVMGEWYALGADAVSRVHAAITDLHLRGVIKVGPAAQSAIRPTITDVIRLLSAAGPAHRLSGGRQWRTERAGLRRLSGRKPNNLARRRSCLLDSDL